MDISLQNELDNTRAQLSQKGKLVRERGHGKFLSWVLEEESLGRKTFNLLTELGTLLCMCKSLDTLVIDRKGE